MRGQVSVDSGCGRGSMSQIALDDAQVYPGFQQMGGVRMSEGMNGDLFVNAAFSHSCMESSLKATLMCWFCVLIPGREEPDRVAMNAPVPTEHMQAGLREWHITIFIAFGLMNVQHLTLPIDITDLQVCSFQQT